MDIVSILIKFGFANRRREGSPGAEGFLPAPSAELRTPMIFLIANMGDKISPNRLYSQRRISSNRQFSGGDASGPKSVIPKTGDSPSPCAKMVRSTKGELVSA